MQCSPRYVARAGPPPSGGHPAADGDSDLSVLGIVETSMSPAIHHSIAVNRGGGGLRRTRQRQASRIAVSSLGVVQYGHRHENWPNGRGGLLAGRRLAVVTGCRPLPTG